MYQGSADTAGSTLLVAMVRALRPAKRTSSQRRYGNYKAPIKVRGFPKKIQHAWLVQERGQSSEPPPGVPSIFFLSSGIHYLLFDGLKFIKGKQPALLLRLPFVFRR